MVAGVSFKVLAEELLATTAQAQQNIESLVAEPTKVQYLITTVECLNQVRGSFLLLEDKGAELLCASLIEVLESLIVVSPENRIKPALVDRISQGILLLNRYIEFRKIRNNPHPELLLTAINSVRAASNKRLYPESWFWPKEVKIASLDLKQKAFNPKLKPFFQHVLALYQKALLEVLRGKDSLPAFRYLTKVSEKIRGYLAGYKAQETWLVAQGLFEAFSQHSTDLTPERKRVFSMFERSLRLFVTQSDKATQQVLGAGSLKEVLYLMALLSDGSGFSGQVLKRYRISPLANKESDLKEMRQLLSGPGASVMDSLAIAVKEELNKIKELADSINRGLSNDWGSIAKFLTQTSQSLKLVGLVSPANVLSNLAKNIVAAEDKDSMLSDLADAVIYVESSLGRVHKSREDDKSMAGSAARAVLQEATIVLLSEAEAALHNIKRAITSFMESEGQAKHLEQMPSILAELVGAMTFLNSQQGILIAHHLSHFVMSRIAIEGTSLDRETFEIFADGLSGLEFFLEENLTHPANIDENSLESAKLSFEALGYKFKAKTP